MTYPQQQAENNFLPPPVPEGAGGMKLSEHVGDLIWCRVSRYDPEAQSQWGTRPTVFLDLEVIAGRSGVGEPVFDSMHSNVILVQQLAGAVGSEFFARVAAKAGSKANPAIHFEPPWQGDEVYTQAFRARRAAQASAPPAPQAPQPPSNGNGYGGGPQSAATPPAPPARPTDQGYPPELPPRGQGPANGQPGTYVPAPTYGQPPF